MYQKIVLCGKDKSKDFLECLHLCPMHVDFAQQSIRSLYLGGALHTSTLINILSLCKGLICLALFIGTDTFINNASLLWGALDALAPKSLIFGMAIDLTTSIRTSNVCKNLIHFEFVNKSVLKKPITDLETLDALMHLCLVLVPYSCNPVSIICLVGNACLQVLVFYMEYWINE